MDTSTLYLMYFVIAVIGLGITYFLIRLAVKDAIKEALKDREKEYLKEKEKLDSLYQSKLIGEAEYNSRRMALPVTVLFQ